jgi:hypothetical protein
MKIEKTKSNSKETLLKSPQTKPYSSDGLNLFTETFIVTIYIKIKKDYKTNGDTEHQGMHNLSGVFVKEEKPESINGVTYYPFSVVYPKKNRTYYCEKENECKGWVQSIRKATGYLNLTDIYEVKVR